MKADEEETVAADRYEALALVNLWDELIALRDRQREQKKAAIQVVKGRRLPLELNAQGLIRWYMHPAIADTVLTTYLFYSQEVPPGSRTGRLKFQGGQVIYILCGRGYTLLNGVKHPWTAGDLLNLPLLRDGVIVQHFNTDDVEPARFIACEPNWFACTSVDRGSGFELLEEAPEFRAARRSS